MGGMMSPVVAIVGAAAAILSIPAGVAVIAIVTMIGNALGLG